MAGRKTILATGEIYHVFNRGISSQPTFFDNRDYQRFLNAFIFYQNREPPMKLSLFLTSSYENREKFIQESLAKSDFLVDNISYCLMPTHFHFLLKQLEDGGISRFISNLTNSYTRFLNTKQKRVGPFFQGRFKAVRIETNEQLLHVSRYIHLNPFASFLVKNIEDLNSYIYSSFPEYLGKVKRELCQKDMVLGQYKTKELYYKFVLDQAGYQRELELIKHLILENR
ncbi:hypothetical protein COT03_00200 [Candidatus Shapirobacteria bacterium CG07_land_8_20_14_0_80_39_18]|uniref:Transposase IS200-like domain-containing protein n=1 Tax=Candidatus Shapirobacteria bacterium CG07_land_8_20_14_0_80_39_18 TaxID=1974882 RepID=A0A2M6YS21_9BACT|nr:MAG: hypothetical protein COT03_00200 [Candidatus Shapirobacteria bacterium CG07_land_8_20_14_0_80_39_18]